MLPSKPSKRTAARRLLRVVVAAVASLTLTLVTAPAVSAGTEIAAGWEILGGTVTGPKPSTPRHLTDRQAAAFIQAWLPASIYGTLTKQDPPTNLTVYTVTVTDTINGTPAKLVAYYTSDGTNAWVSMPPQDLGGAMFVADQTWLLAPPRTIAAFEGKLEPVPPAGAPAPPAAVTSAPASSVSQRSDNSSPWLLIAASAAGIAAIIAALALVRRRRPRTTDAPRPKPVRA
jgi:hypothetical protein